MKTSDDHHREALTKYDAMESGAELAAVVLLLAALAAGWMYRPSAWFVLGCALGGALIFLRWRATIGGNGSTSSAYSLVAVAALVGALVVEIHRPLQVLLACSFSVLGTVLFGLIAVTRRTRR
jgi:hypothetical protein